MIKYNYRYHSFGVFIMYKNIYDTHTHSDNSFDGHFTCIQMCRAAIEKGAVGIAITDHCDIDGVGEDCWSFEDKQFSDCQKAIEKYGNDIKIYPGVELGQGIYKKDLAERFLNSYDFDFVLGSVHNLENMEDFYYLNFKNFDIYELLERYFNDILRLARWNKTDSIAHLTYPLRYIAEREKINVDLYQFDDVITEIFKTVINNEKAIELNVSGLTMPLADTMPNKALIKRFHDMGGKYVTLGSDSHYCDRVCNNIEVGMSILKECGFTHFTVFEKRKPKLIPIE